MSEQQARLYFKDCKGLFEVWLRNPEKIYKSTRILGKIRDIKGIPTFVTKRDPERHLMKCNNSIGICDLLLREGSLYFDEIIIRFGTRQLRTTRKFWLEHGEHLHFQGNSLELQSFLPLDKFGIREARKWEQQHEEEKKKMLAEEFVEV